MIIEPNQWREYVNNSSGLDKPETLTWHTAVIGYLDMQDLGLQEGNKRQID